MKRSKIAITIKDDILKRLDRAVDGETIRNRSHAIEYFLNQALSAKIETALIIAGKKEFSCATLFEGKPVIEHELEFLKSGGVRQVIVLLPKKEKEVQKMIGDGSKYGLLVDYIWQDDDKIGTAHAVSLVRQYTKDDTILVMYCDVVAHLDLVDFAAYHNETGALATVAVTSIEDPSLYGSVQMRGEKIVGFTEKPQEKSEVSRVISSGIFCLSPEIFEYIPDKKLASLEKDVFPKLVKEGKLAGYMFEGKWCNVRNQICYPATK